MPEHDNIPKPLPTLTLSDIERFKSKINTLPGQGPNGDCHAFMGARTPRGYGVFEVCKYGKAQSIRANRVAYFIYHGTDPAPDLVKHSCDWPPCCRGEHLSCGDNASNMREAAERNRMASGDQNGSRLHPEKLVRGDAHGMSKSKDEDIAKMREMYAAGMTATAIAKQFGIAVSTACRNIRGQLRAHVDAPTVGSLTVRGERHPGFKATPEIKAAIRADRLLGLTYATMSAKYDLSPGRLHWICNKDE